MDCRGPPIILTFNQPLFFFYYGWSPGLCFPPLPLHALVNCNCKPNKKCVFFV
jgi:hypothetical protein